MKLIFAKKLGSCFGVKRAINLCEKILKEDPKPVQFFGKPIHNQTVIEKIKKMGGKFVSNLKKVKTGTLVIRAHGASPFHLSNNVKIRDLTCPLVKRAQLAAFSLLKEGYKVIIIGEKKHPEVRGIMGHLKNQGIIIENEKEAKKLPKLEKIGIVSQTTQNFEKVKKILKILKTKTKKFKFINTLCPEVISRQKEAIKILKKVDGILIVGAYYSSNIKQLVKIIRSKSKQNKKKIKIFWVNSLKELKKKKIKEISTLGVISGTSVLDWEIAKIKQYLENLEF